MSLKNKSRAAFAAVVLFGAFTLTEMALLLFHHAANVVHDGSIRHYFKGMDQGNAVLGMAISLFLIFLVAQIVWNIAKQVRLLKRWQTLFWLLKDEAATQRLNERHPELKNHILVVQHREFLALTIGFVNPKVVLSTFVMEHFSEKELQAILFHEQFHLMHRDPLKRMMTQIVLGVLGYVPLLKRLVQYYHISRELLADRYAMEKMNHNEALGSVLLKVAKMGECRSFGEAAAQFAQSPMHYRILQVIDPNDRLSIPIMTKRSFAVSLILLLANLYVFANCFAGQVLCRIF